MPDWSQVAGPDFDITFQMDWRGVDVVLVDGDTPLPAQKCIVAQKENTHREKIGEAGQAGNFRIVLIGYRGVTGKPDFNVKHGFLFDMNDTTWQVTYVDDTIPGRREAYSESRQ